MMRTRGRKAIAVAVLSFARSSLDQRARLGRHRRLSRPRSRSSTRDSAELSPAATTAVSDEAIQNASIREASSTPRRARLHPSARTTSRRSSPSCPRRPQPDGHQGHPVPRPDRVAVEQRLLPRVQRQRRDDGVVRMGAAAVRRSSSCSRSRWVMKGASGRRCASPTCPSTCAPICRGVVTHCWLLGHPGTRSLRAEPRVRDLR